VQQELTCWVWNHKTHSRRRSLTWTHYHAVNHVPAGILKRALECGGIDWAVGASALMRDDQSVTGLSRWNTGGFNERSSLFDSERPRFEACQASFQARFQFLYSRFGLIRRGALQLLFVVSDLAILKLYLCGLPCYLRIFRCQVALEEPIKVGMLALIIGQPAMRLSHDPSGTLSPHNYCVIST
jgi:hypothetical protein